MEMNRTLIFLLCIITLCFITISGCTETPIDERVLPNDFVAKHTGSFFYIYDVETITVNYTPVGDESFMTIEPYTRICGKSCHEEYYDSFVYRDFSKNISQPISLYQNSNSDSYRRTFDGVRITITGKYSNEDYIIKKMYYIYPDFTTNNLVVKDIGY